MSVPLWIFLYTKTLEGSIFIGLTVIKVIHGYCYSDIEIKTKPNSHLKVEFIVKTIPKSQMFISKLKFSAKGAKKWQNRQFS